MWTNNLRGLIRVISTSYGVWRSGSVKFNEGVLSPFYAFLQDSVTHFTL